MRGLRDWVMSALSVGWATALTVGMWAAIGLILIFGAWAAFRPIPRPPATKVPESTTSAEGTAEVCVVSWLRAGKDSAPSLKPCFGDVDLRDATPLPPEMIGRAGAVASEERAPGYWSVTVAVEITTPAPPTTAQSPTTLGPTTTARYYRVGIRRDAERFAASALPEPTSAPVGGTRSNLAAGRLDRPATNDPVAATVQSYLGALLAGDGELGRYTWPGAGIVAVSPAPYASVKLLRLAAVDIGELRKEVLAEASAVDAQGHTQTVNVTLEVARRAGRWEVAKDLPAPSLAKDQPTAPSTTVAPALRPITTVR